MTTMTKIAEATVACTDKPAAIYTPLNIGEQTRASGFAFSKRLARQTGINQNELSPAFFEGSQVFKHAELAQKLASDSAGGATIGENSITLWVASGNTTASEADSIWMYFGLDKRVQLLGRDGRFPEGAELTWDLNNLSDWLEDNVTADLWDEIALTTDSTDGIKIDRVRIKHSGQTILDWECGLWLDGSKTAEYGKIVLTGKILETKLNAIENLWVPQIHWAAREIGKTDGAKYGSTGAWCSEFASWCLRKAMWETPDRQHRLSGHGRLFCFLGPSLYARPADRRSVSARGRRLHPIRVGQWGTAQRDFHRIHRRPDDSLGQYIHSHDRRQRKFNSPHRDPGVQGHPVGRQLLMRERHPPPQRRKNQTRRPRKDNKGA